MRLAVLLLVLGCSKPEAPLAELTKAEGTVDKQETTDWTTAPIGTEFRLGNAARTGTASTAQLAVASGAQITMEPNTILRFGDSANAGKISVEGGAIELQGTGNYSLDIGEVSLQNNGKLRLTAEGLVKLGLGAAEVTTLTGKRIKLAVDEELEIGSADVTPLRDAGVADAPQVAEPPDAAPEPTGAEATAEITGKKGELMLPGETRWKPLPAGTAALPRGAKLKLGANTTAKLVAGGTTLALGGGSRVSVGDDYAFTLEAGSGAMSVTGEGKVNVPGGAVAMTSTGNAPSEAKLEGGTAGTKVTGGRGSAKLTGTSGSELDLDRGEVATILKTGTIRPLEAIPAYFDLRIIAGESLTIHDPKPPTSVQFQFGGKCPDGGIIELDRDPRFRTAKVSAGKEAANHLVRGGTHWSYRLRCTAGAREGNAVASGRIAVVADSGTRALPQLPGVNPFQLDGRPWNIKYQSVIPDLAVQFPGGGSSFRLHLARGGKELTFDSSSNRLLLKGSSLTEGSYTYWFDRDGVRQDKVNSLVIEFVQTAPQVYIELPVNGRPFADAVDVKGAVLPGWSAAVEGVPITIDRARRFSAQVRTPPGNALAIRLSHPQRGVHYYLRRQK